MMGFNFMSLSAAFLANSQHRRCRGQLFQILFQETEVNHSSREVFLKTAARTCSKNKRTEMVYSIFFVARDTSCRSLFKVVFFHHETRSKGLKPARRIVVLFCSPFSKTRETTNLEAITSAIQCNFPS